MNNEPVVKYYALVEHGAEGVAFYKEVKRFLGWQLINSDMFVEIEVERGFLGKLFMPSEIKTMWVPDYHISIVKYYPKQSCLRT